MSQQAGKSSFVKRVGRRLFFRLGVLAVSLVVLLFLGIAISVSGSVSGSEFTPSHFQTRSFSFHEIPWLHIQLTPIKRSSPRNVARFLRSGSYLPVTRGKASVWHLKDIQRGVQPSKPADADLLVRYLEIRTTKGNFWAAWSAANPEAARVLWPTVQKLAERELYVLMPGVFQIAVEKTGVQDVLRQLKSAKKNSSGSKASVTMKPPKPNAPNSESGSTTPSGEKAKPSESDDPKPEDEDQAEVPDVASMFPDDLMDEPEELLVEIDPEKKKARRQDEAVALQNALDAYLREQYVQLAQEMVDAEKELIAAGILEEAMQDFPEDEEIRDLRATLPEIEIEEEEPEDDSTGDPKAA